MGSHQRGRGKKAGGALDCDREVTQIAQAAEITRNRRGEGAMSEEMEPVSPE